MANKPEWVDNCPAKLSPDGTAKLLGEGLQYCDRIVLGQMENGRYYAYIYMLNGETHRRSRNDFKDLLISIQEVLLP